MKPLLSTIFVLMATFAAPSASAWWLAPTDIQINPHVVHASVFNGYPFAIYCEGRVFGQVQNGQWLHSWIRSWIAPGTYAYVYIYANPPFFFVNANSEVYCR